MATLTSIRERQKVVLWAFLIIFLLSLSIGGLVGGANIIDQIFGSNLTGNAVGAVNSDRITFEELSQAISLQTEQSREQYGELNDQLIDVAETQAWDNLVNVILLNAEIGERRLAATGDEIFYVLENYPPPFLQQNEVFQTEGEFDPNLYYQALNNPTGSEWAPVEAYLANLLPGEKMSNLIRAIAYTSEEEVKSAWYDRNTEATVDYIYTATNKINTDDLVISDAGLRSIYRRNRNNYYRDETRILEYVYWAKSPTAEDSAEVEETAKQLVERARSGEDFERLALDYSEDPGSGPSGGDLGWFGEGQMVAPFEKAAFNAVVGDIVGPVETQFGFHVIKVEERREDDDGPKVKARHILLKIDISPGTQSSLRSQANIFSFDAVDSSFQVAASSRGLTSLTSPPLTATDKYLPPPLGMLRSAVRFAFNSEEVGLISGVLENERVYVVARLAEIRPDGVAPMEEVRDDLERLLRQETAEEQVALIMANIHQQLADSAEWEAVADSFPEAVYTNGVSAKLNSSFAGLGRSPILSGVLRTIDPGQTSEVITLERGAAIVKLINRQEPDWEQYASTRETEHQRLLNRRLNAIWNLWLTDLKAQADIIDNRHLFF
ncbi:MAG: peptidylprolyl isomerase [Fidelibacterota bacterium]|nr:MAG: peptidylprolyl isomerase [Candidatus Neomarinimicrobiota bacterium]